MKKWLFLFVVIDLVFVALVLQLANRNDSRNIASDNNHPGLSQRFTAGQQRKLNLVQSFRFSIDTEKIVLTSDLLQALCETASLVEVHFTALNVAVAGGSPTIIHTFSCEAIRQIQSQNTLETKISDLTSSTLRQNKILDLGVSRLRTENLYSDEEFPEDWRVFSIKIIGPSSFSISSAELDLAHDPHHFEFQLK